MVYPPEEGRRLTSLPTKPNFDTTLVCLSAVELPIIAAAAAADDDDDDIVGACIVYSA